MNPETRVLLTNKVADLVLLLESIEMEGKKLNDLERVLDEEMKECALQKKDLSARELKLFQKEDILKKETVRIEEEKTYIISKTRSFELDKQYIKDIEIAKEEWETRKKEALNQERIVEEKRKELIGLVDKKKELEERELMITKSIAIDVERKKLLDIREERIRNQENRLHIEQAE